MVLNRLNVTVVGDKAYLGGDKVYLPSNLGVLQDQIETFRYILIGMYACVFWEHIITFGEESWTNGIAAAIFFFGRPPSCQGTLTWVFVSYFLIWAITALIFIKRIQGLCFTSKTVVYFVWVAYIIACCFWAVSLGFFYSSPLPSRWQLPRVPRCIVLPSSFADTLGFGASACFDVLVLILTVSKARSMLLSTQTGRSGRTAQSWIIYSAVVYAFACLTCNASSFFLWLLQKNIILRSYSIPFAAAINPIVASRIVFHASSWIERRPLLRSRSSDITEQDVYHWRNGSAVAGASPMQQANGRMFALEKSFDRRSGDEALVQVRPAAHPPSRSTEMGKVSTNYSRQGSAKEHARPFADAIVPLRTSSPPSCLQSRQSGTQDQESSHLPEQSSCEQRPVRPCLPSMNLHAEPEEPHACPSSQTHGDWTIEELLDDPEMLSNDVISSYGRGARIHRSACALPDNADNAVPVPLLDDDAVRDRNGGVKRPDRIYISRHISVKRD